MRVGVIGINHKLANLELRELLARACQKRITLAGCAQDSHTFILLSTCNRSEIYFTSDHLPETHSYLLQLLRDEVKDDFDQKVYSYFGQDCFLHLCRVTAGLDSAIVAETEIQGQVKNTYESAANTIQLPNELHYIFQKALKIGKNVRSSLTLGRGMPDLEHAIFNTGMHFFDGSTKANVLFVGASEVNCKVLNFLKSKQIENITICNRSFSKAKAISDTYQVPVLEWSKFGQWSQFNWIILGTKAPNYLITKADLPKQCVSQKLLIDLSVPRNVEPSVGRDSRMTLLNIDQMNRILKMRKHRMTHMLNQAEQMISSSVARHVHLFQKREQRDSYALS